MTEAKRDEILARVPVMEDKLDRILFALDCLIKGKDIDGVLFQDNILIFDESELERKKKIREELMVKEEMFNSLNREMNELRSQFQR